jgi:hypothetical protein
LHNIPVSNLHLPRRKERCLNEYGGYSWRRERRMGMGEREREDSVDLVKRREEGGGTRRITGRKSGWLLDL